MGELHMAVDQTIIPEHQLPKLICIDIENAGANLRLLSEFHIVDMDFSQFKLHTLKTLLGFQETVSMVPLYL